MADQLITRAELATYLQLPDPGVDNATADLAIQTATGTVQAACRQRLIQATDAVTIQAVYGPWLDLPERPVTAVTTVVIGASTITDYTLVTHPRTGQSRLWRATGWWSPTAAASASWEWWYPTAPQLVTVTHTHGYPTGDYRLDYARSVVLELAAATYRNPDGVRSEAIDDYQVSYSDAASQPRLTPDTIKALRRQYGISAGTTTIGAHA